MNGISLGNDIGTLSLALYNASQTSQTIGTLSAEGSSGLISSEYAGLGTQAGTALDLTSQLALNKADQSSATQAATQSQVAQTALSQIQSLVSNISAQLLEPADVTSVGLASIASSAQSALQQVAGLLNTRVGDTYVFAGQDSRNPPIPNASQIGQSAFYAAIQAAVAGLSANGAASVHGQVLGAAQPGATSPFSSTLEASNQPAMASLSDGQTVQLGVLADTNANAVSAGAPATSTGSYTRDILASFATLATMGTENPGDAQVQALLTSTQSTLSHADDALNTDIGGLGTRQQVITAAQTELTATATALTTQLGSAQDADPAQVATQLSTAETQLQASYKIIADLQQLSLAKYL